MEYGKRFKNIKTEVIEATKEMAKIVWTNESNEIKFDAMNVWVQKVSLIYGVDCPSLSYSPNRGQYLATGGGIYNPLHNEITLYYKFSVVTLIHEFRHCLQYKKAGLKMVSVDIEEDARAWSMSLFKKACPKSYKKAIETGAVHHI